MIGNLEKLAGTNFVYNVMIDPCIMQTPVWTRPADPALLCYDPSLGP
jgi:hypothetical protein